MQIGVRQVIAGWDEGILGDGKDVPPMKVYFSSLCMQQILAYVADLRYCVAAADIQSHQNNAMQRSLS